MWQKVFAVAVIIKIINVFIIINIIIIIKVITSNCSKTAT